MIMKNSRFELEPYHYRSKKHCPKCNKKSFTQYIDTGTNQSIDDAVGYCDHILACGYHYTPKQYFRDHRLLFKPSSNQQIAKPNVQEKSPSFLSSDIMQASLKGYNLNNLVKFLNQNFDKKAVSETLQKYFVGTSKYWAGSTVFWQIDVDGRIRSGKIIQFDPQTGKRVKEPLTLINWVHRVLKIEDYVLKQCLFGEHLLKDSTKIIGLVESEKTALIASICLPQFTWLATGGLKNFSEKKFAVLRGRTVILFPDVNGFEIWNKQAIELTKQLPGSVFKVSDLVEKNATENERESGFDIADYLIQSLERNHLKKTEFEP